MKNALIAAGWFEPARMSTLAEYLQSVPSFELTKNIASEFSDGSDLEHPRQAVIENFIVLTKNFMAAFFEEIRPEVENHAFNYPFLRLGIPGASYDSTSGRANYQKIQSLARKIPSLGKRYLPKPIQNPVVAVILPGVDYSAESLISSGSLERDELPEKSMLGWQHLDAYADYCMGLMTMGRETYSSLLDAWYYSNDSDMYFRALEVLAEETLHHISDEIAGPRYGESAIEKEHYWMKSYGEFPERVDIALLRLKDEFLGRLKEKLSQLISVPDQKREARFRRSETIELAP